MVRQFTIASAARLMRTVCADIRDHEVAVFDFTDTVYMDDSAAVMASSRFVPMLPVPRPEEPPKTPNSHTV